MARGWVVSVLLGLWLAAGCGDDDSSSAPAATTAPPEAAPSAAEEVTTTIAGAEGVATTVAGASSSTLAPGTESGPGVRGYHEMVYDSESDALLVLGGCRSDDCDPLHDAWRFDPEQVSWQQIADVPHALMSAGGPAAYDAESDRVVFLGVVFQSYEGGLVSTWTYDYDTDTWTEMEPDLEPRLGVGARMAYDAKSDRLIAYGGQAIGADGVVYTPGTWAYDLNTDTWEERSPSVSPPGVNYHAMAYDAGSDRTVLFGLTDDEQSLLWAYDYNSDSWEELELDAGPVQASVYARAVYDPEADRILVFGGGRPAPEGLLGHDELWRYDYDTNTWEQAAANDLSGPLLSHGMAALEPSGTVVVFGGGPSWTEFAGDGAWAYDPATDTWTELQW